MSVPDIQNVLDLLRQREMDTAIAELESKVREIPAHLTAHVLLARAYESKERWDEALRSWENAHFLMPNSPTVEKGKARVLKMMEASSSTGDGAVPSSDEDSPDVQPSARAETPEKPETPETAETPTAKAAPDEDTADEAAARADRDALTDRIMPAQLPASRAPEKDAEKAPEKDAKQDTPAEDDSTDAAVSGEDEIQKATDTRDEEEASPASPPNFPSNIIQPPQSKPSSEETASEDPAKTQAPEAKAEAASADDSEASESDEGQGPSSGPDTAQLAAELLPTSMKPPRTSPSADADEEMELDAPDADASSGIPRGDVSSETFEEEMDRESTPTAEHALSELDKLRKRAEQEARSGGARADMARELQQRKEEETKARGEEDDDETRDPVTGDLDRLIQELEEARFEPRPDLEDVPEPDLDDDVDDVVSETLARIHAAQGQYRESARIYVKLAAQEPGRARYFLQHASDMREKAEAAEAEAEEAAQQERSS